MPVPHSTYYRDRYSERDLCHDFPGDEILIDGLHAMQRHFWNNNVSIDIPVVRVMNTAHFIAAYMFATSCSGDQMEYDALAYDSFCRDRQLMQVTIIVLAAMLQRTEGFRARQCRNVLLQDRSPDFDYGVTLYDRFLRSAEKRFAEEDFLMDTGAQIQRLQAENKQLITENTQLKYTITTMEQEQQNKPQTIVYNYGSYIAEQNIDIHDNHNCRIYATAQPEEEQETGGKQAYLPPIPEKGAGYNAVREYIEERMKYDEAFRIQWISHTLKQNCIYLSEEFGWVVDEHSLGANLNRHK